MRLDAATRTSAVTAPVCGTNRTHRSRSLGRCPAAESSGALRRTGGDERRRTVVPPGISPPAGPGGPPAVRDAEGRQPHRSQQRRPAQPAKGAKAEGHQHEYHHGARSRHPRELREAAYPCYQQIRRLAFPAEPQHQMGGRHREPHVEDRPAHGLGLGQEGKRARGQEGRRAGSAPASGDREFAGWGSGCLCSGLPPHRTFLSPRPRARSRRCAARCRARTALRTIRCGFEVALRVSSVAGSSGSSARSWTGLARPLSAQDPPAATFIEGPVLAGGTPRSEKVETGKAPHSIPRSKPTCPMESIEEDLDGAAAGGQVDGTAGVVEDLQRLLFGAPSTCSLKNDSVDWACAAGVIIAAGTGGPPWPRVPASAIRGRPLLVPAWTLAARPGNADRWVNRPEGSVPTMPTKAVRSEVTELLVPSGSRAAGRCG